MSKLIYILILFFTLNTMKSQSWELYGKDTINKIDADGKKQAKWVLMGKHKPGTCYQTDQKAEEGAALPTGEVPFRVVDDTPLATRVAVSVIQNAQAQTGALADGTVGNAQGKR